MGSTNLSRCPPSVPIVKIHGAPGRHPARLARRRTRSSIAATVVGFGGAFAAVLSGRPALALTFVVVGLMVRHRLRGRAYAARVGAEAESAVAERIRGFRPEVALFGLDLRGRRADVDAVVLGPVAATVEVKRASGRVRVMDDGTVRVGRTWLPGRPLSQAAAHAAAVGRFTEEHVEAVLCITGMRQRGRVFDHGSTEVWVTSARRLPATLRRLPRVLTSREARQLAQRLRSGNNPSQAAQRSVT